MKISQKKTCGNCKALVDIPHSVYLTCEFGYKIERQSWYTPLEPCPKPITYKEFYFALNNYNKLNSVVGVADSDNQED